MRYHRNTIILLNAIMFFLCAIRITTEYYVHQIDSFAIANQILIFHSFIANTVGILLWGCTYFYIRPLRGKPNEKFWNTTLLVVSFPILLLTYYALYNRLVYQTVPEKANGLWMFTVTEGSWWTFLVNASSIFYSLFILSLFIYEIIMTRHKVLFKSLLSISFIVFPVVAMMFTTVSVEGQATKVPNVGFILLAHTAIVSWFCSDYRFFQNNFTNAVKDILNSVADLTIYTDLQYRTQFANAATKELFQTNKIRDNLAFFLAGYSTLTMLEMKQYITELITKKANKHELRIMVKEEQHHLILQSKPFYRANQHIGYIFILNNATALRRNQALLEQSNHTKDQLFAIIGHDLRKPAIAFRGISKKVNYLLQRNDFKTLQQLGKSWDAAANSLNHLIDNLLNWALQQRGILPIEPQIITLPHAVSNSVESLQNLITDKHIELILDVPDNTKVLADFNSVVTIMRNVLDNAIKFTPEHGHIEVTANVAPQHVQIRVRDSGIGMNEQQINELFNLKKGKSRKGTAGESGTGIGLNLVRELIILNEGEVFAESQPNQGTTINIILPNAA